MPDSVPVSPAAQAVDGGPPDLWWSPGLAADTLDAQDGVVTNDRGQLYRQQNATWRYIEALPADAVRLVPAPGPDTELPAADTRLPASDVRAWWCRAGVFIGTGSRVFIGHPFGDSREVPNPESTARALLAAGREAMAVRTDGETPQ